MPAIPPPKNESPTLGRSAPGPRGLSRTAVNFILDFCLLVVLVGLIGSTAILRFVFPRATAATGWSLWGLGYNEWADFQFGLLCLFLVGVLLHVMLHWNWVCSVIAARWPRRSGQKAPRPEEGAQTLYGVGTLIVILTLVGLLLAAASLSVRAP